MVCLSFLLCCLSPHLVLDVEAALKIERTMPEVMEAEALKKQIEERNNKLKDEMLGKWMKLRETLC